MKAKDLDSHLNVAIGPQGRSVYCKHCKTAYVVVLNRNSFKHGYWYGIGRVSKAKATIREHIRTAHPEVIQAQA